MVDCLAYIDLNPLQARLVERAEDYRWNSLGYHVQTNNQDNFLSTDFGLEEFNVKSEKERIRRYRRYVYEAEAINRPDKMIVDRFYGAKEGLSISAKLRNK